jgi:hypothetical protein
MKAQFSNFTNGFGGSAEAGGMHESKTIKVNSRFMACESRQDARRVNAKRCRVGTVKGAIAD